jgi:hypothetical protein
VAWVLSLLGLGGAGGAAAGGAGASALGIGASTGAFPAALRTELGGAGLSPNLASNPMAAGRALGAQGGGGGILDQLLRAYQSGKLDSKQAPAGMPDTSAGRGSFVDYAAQANPFLYAARAPRASMEALLTPRRTPFHARTPV